MEKSFLTATAIITVILTALFAGSGLTPTVHAAPLYLEGKLTITGLLEHQLNLSSAELAAMPKTTVNAAIICVDYPGYVVTEGNWVGVSLGLLLETAGASPSAVKVAFFASDGYSTDLTLETAMREDVILAYEKDDVPLSEGLRLVVPGKWGYKWISQVASIELVDYDFKGFWESRGYSDDADIDGSVPEFPSVTFLLMPLIVIALFMLMLKKKAKLGRPFKP